MATSATVRPWEGHEGGFEVFLDGALAVQLHADRTVDLRQAIGPSGDPFAEVPAGAWVRTHPAPAPPPLTRLDSWPAPGFWLYRVSERGQAAYQSGPM